MADWRSATIGDFFDLSSGFAFKSEEFLAAGIPVIKIKNIKAGYFSDHDFSYVSEEFFSSRANKLAKFNDLLISMSGNRHDGSPETWVGKVANFRKCGRYFINQRVGALRPKRDSEVDVRFAAFLFSSIPYQELFISIATSSGGQANLSPRQVLSAPFRYPSIEIQRSIGETLGALDDKIELNRRMNETLEAMARAIFKDWFVDFGPTRAKMEGRAPYLAPDIWSLFPALLDDEGKPEGWNAGSLSDVASLNPESWSRMIYPEMVDYVDLSNTKWGTIEAITPYTREAAPSRAQRILRPGDTIVGTVRPGNGSYAYVSVQGLTGSTGFAVLRPKDQIFREVVFLAVTAKENIDRLAHLADGGAYPAIRPELVTATELVTAPERLFAAFSATTSALIERAEANKQESQTLAATRDFLLPKLMSGEVRVREAEKAVEAAQ
jgi:type I restriction enzyme S subunit